jgi:anti-sigma factor RsiW
MNTSSSEQWREPAWRSRLDPTQAASLNAFLEAHPELREDWEEELRLTRILEQLPDPALASNFTAQVVAVAQGEPRRRRRSSGWFSLRGLRPTSLMPRMAWAILILGVCLVSFQQYRSRERHTMAARLAALPLDTVVADATLWRDFAAIRALPPTPTVDLELLAALD